jgi:hypothetical protein
VAQKFHLIRRVGTGNGGAARDRVVRGKMMSEPVESPAPIEVPVNQDGDEVEWRLEIEATPSLISRFAAFGVNGQTVRWTLCFDSDDPWEKCVK